MYRINYSSMFVLPKFYICLVTSVVDTSEPHRIYCQRPVNGQSVLTRLHLECNVFVISCFSHCIICNFYSPH